MMLPPYSPELNPVEHVWDALREKYFHNRVFSSLKEVESARVDSLEQRHLQTPQPRRTVLLQNQALQAHRSKWWSGISERCCSFAIKVRYCTVVYSLFYDDAP